MLKLENHPRFKNMTFLKYWKYIVLFALGLFGLTAIEVIIELATSAIAAGVYGPTTSEYFEFTHSVVFTMIINGAGYMILFAIFMFFASKDINEYVKSFKHWQPYVAGVIGFVSIIAFNIIYNFILSVAGVDTSVNTNQSTLNTVVASFPIASLFIFAFIGPICEELTYRVGLFTFFRKINGVLAYLITIIIFSLIHFDFASTNIVNELLNLPFYVYTAFVFSFLYEKFGLAGSLTAHIVNNFISVLTTILEQFFK